MNRLVIVCILLAIGLATVFGCFNLPMYLRLAQRGVPAEATVKSKDCQNHGLFSYTFLSEGLTYEGKGTAGHGLPECGSLTVGDKVLVYYLPSDPGTNRPGNIHQRLRNEIISVALVVVVLPLTAFLFGWYKISRYTRQKPDERPGE